MDPEINASSLGTQNISSLAECFEQQVAKSPSAIACTHGTKTITYKKLNEDANQLAHYLKERGVGPDSFVGISAPRSIDSIIGILAIIKSGGAYVPLDPTYPSFRLEQILNDTHAMFILSTKETNALLPQSTATTITLDDLPLHVKECKIENPTGVSKDHNLAYVMYTSGTTGKPKGILIEQSSVINLVLNQKYLNIDSEHSMMHLSNIGFDASTFEIWGALLQGANLIIVDQLSLLNFPEFKNILSKQNKSCSFITTSLFERMVIDDPSFFKGADTVLFGGEACNSQTIKDYVNQASQDNLPKNLLNVYGPTECTTFTTYYRIVPNDKHETIPIGVPLENVSVILLDEKLKPVSKLKTGEICVSGKGLARGYLNQPNETQDSFIDIKGVRYYRTGDLAKKLADENFDYQGRLDNQMKIRGHRVEPSEIENILQEVPDVEKAFVTTEKNNKNEKELIAYLTLPKSLIRMLYDGPCQIKWEDEQVVTVKVVDLSQGGICVSGADRKTVYREKLSIILPDILGKTELKGEAIWQAKKVIGVHFLEANEKINKYIDKYYKETHDVIPQHRNFKAILEKRLPHYMIPARYIVLSNFPLLKNGKIDQVALQKIYSTLKENLAEMTPQDEAQSVSEEILMQLWREVLSVPKVGREDNFFEVGGHSLLATKILTKLKKYYHANISFQDFFSNPMLSQLAILIGNELENSEYEPIAVVPRNQRVRLSFAQEQMWFFEQFHPKSPLYNIPIKVILTGDLSIQTLQKSIDQLKQRHQILCTSYMQDPQGIPYQRISSEQNVQLKAIDLSSTVYDQIVLNDIYRQEIEQPFSLTNGPLYRVLVVQLKNNENVIIMTFHHSIIDGWSLSVLAQDVSEFYNANIEKREPNLPNLPIQYLDYSAWQRAVLSPEHSYYQELVIYWKKHLQDAPAKLSLPFDFSRPNSLTYKAGSVNFALDRKLTSSLKGLSLNARCTLYMTLFGAFYAFLFQQSGVNDIVIGTPIANRNRTEVDNLIGLFVNTLAIRVSSIPTAPFSKVLQDIKKTLLESYQHQDLPFECLVKEYSVERQLNYHPIFQVLFVLQNAESPDFSFNRSEVSETTEIAIPFIPFDIVMNLEEIDDELKGAIQYSSELFKEETMQDWAKQWVYLLQIICSNHQVKLNELGKL